MLIFIRHRLTLAAAPGHAHIVEQLLLTPPDTPTQKVRRWRIDMPGIEGAARFVDGFGNAAVLVSQTRPEGEIAITIEGEVETREGSGVIGRLPGDPGPGLFHRPSDLAHPDAELIAGLSEQPSDRVATLHALMARVRRAHGLGEEEDGETEDASRPQGQSQSDGGQGQAQQRGGPTTGEDDGGLATDLAHAFIGGCKGLGIPARFVIGYRLAGEAQAGAFHAWAEAYGDGLGWIGFDCLLGLCPTDRHVRVASGLDADSARPVRAWPNPDAVRSVDVGVREVIEAR